MENMRSDLFEPLQTKYPSKFFKKYKEWLTESKKYKNICPEYGKLINQKTIEIQRSVGDTKIKNIEEQKQLINRWRICHFLIRFSKSPFKIIKNELSVIEKVSPVLYKTLKLSGQTVLSNKILLSTIIRKLNKNINDIAVIIQPGDVSRLKVRDFFIPIITTTLLNYLQTQQSIYIVNNSSYKVEEFKGFEEISEETENDKSETGVIKNYEIFIGTDKGVYTPYNLQNLELFTYENGYIITENFKTDLESFRENYNIFKIKNTIFRDDSFGAANIKEIYQPLTLDSRPYPRVCTTNGRKVITPLQKKWQQLIFLIFLYSDMCHDFGKSTDRRKTAVGKRFKLRERSTKRVRFKIPTPNAYFTEYYLKPLKLHISSKINGLLNFIKHSPDDEQEGLGLEFGKLITSCQISKTKKKTISL